MRVGGWVLAVGVIVANFFVVYAQCESFLSLKDPAQVMLSLLIFGLLLAYVLLIGAVSSCVIVYAHQRLSCVDIGGVHSLAAKHPVQSSAIPSN